MLVHHPAKFHWQRVGGSYFVGSILTVAKSLDFGAGPRLWVNFVSYICSAPIMRGGGAALGISTLGQWPCSAQPREAHWNISCASQSSYARTHALNELYRDVPGTLG